MTSESGRPDSPTRRLDGSQVRRIRRRVANSRWQRLVRTFRIDQAPTMRRLPKVTIRARAHIPAWVLRIALLALAGWSWMLVGPPALVTVLAAVIACTFLIRPGGVLPALYAVVLGFGLLTSAADPMALRNFALLATLHALVQLAAAVGNAGWSALVELSVLLAPARRFLAIQVPLQLLALAAAWLRAREITAGWLVLLGGIALAGFSWWLLSRLNDRVVASESQSTP